MSPPQVYLFFLLRDNSIDGGRRMQAEKHIQYLAAQIPQIHLKVM